MEHSLFHSRSLNIFSATRKSNITVRNVPSHQTSMKYLFCRNLLNVKYKPKKLVHLEILCLWCPIFYTLSDDEKIILQSIEKRLVSNLNGFRCQRFTYRGKVFTDSTYALNKRRNNSVVLVGQHYFIIQRCIYGRFFCSCIGVCDCQPNAYIFCNPLLSHRNQCLTLHDDYSGRLLSGNIERKTKSDLVKCFRISSIDRKVVMLTVGDDIYVTPLRYFELD